MYDRANEEVHIIFHHHALPYAEPNLLGALDLLVGSTFTLWFHAYSR